jgi:transcriptional regulator with XRE-family HTH domain
MDNDSGRSVEVFGDLDLQAFGDQLRLVRLACGLSQATVAWRADISTNHYNKIERGGVDCSIGRLYALCQVLGTSADVLLGLGAART